MSRCAQGRLCLPLGAVRPTWTTSGQAPTKGAYSDAEGCSGGGELWYSIEPIVQAWGNGEQDHDLVLMSALETTAINWRQYYSEEGGPWDRNQPDHAPVLFIQYEPPLEFSAYMRVGEPLPATYEKAKALAEDPVRNRGEATLPEPATVSNDEALHYGKAPRPTQSSHRTTCYRLRTPRQPIPHPHQRLRKGWWPRTA
ncbi:hypothetical protein [Nonomuraea gerenzanensis]|uniref:hypothetical protein n=1 Tax=Nonomuraea gerenzanensis TaxID=93944 RepID=UPI001CD9B789|nr:hypothetical protein [Nonomuraea gerenzanensis]UBU12564.1 hypothetical protein LCN96_51275 [Nonomuraea gerenzanensis]